MLQWFIFYLIPLKLHVRFASNLAQVYLMHHIAPGSIVHSDEWRAYSRVVSNPAVASHSTVNHSITFVDPTTGTHTQHIESFWNRVKLKLKRMKGCHSDQIPSYLDEFMWLERHGQTSHMAWINIMRDIAQQYPM